MNCRWVAAAIAALSLGLAGPAFADGKGATAPLRKAGSGAPPPVAGPAVPQGITGTAPMPNGASVIVPAGWRLYGAPEAKAYLGRIGKTAAPGDVMGMLAPETGKLTDKDFRGVVLTWSPIGHVTASGADQFTQPTFLASVKAARGVAQPAPESLPISPTYAQSTATLAWAEQFAAASPTDRNVRLESRVLARDGFTGATIHCRISDLDARKPDLAKVAAAIAFPAGRRHADFRPGDLASGFDLPGLVTGTRPTQALVETASAEGPKPQAAEDAAPSWFPWIGGALIGIPLVLWLIYGRRRAEPPEADTLILTPRPTPPPTPKADPTPEPPTPPAGSGEPRRPPSGPDPNLTPPAG